MMLSKNVGLKSRFQRFFDFPDWSGNDCTTFIENLAKKENYELRPEVRALFPARFDELVRYPGNKKCSNLLTHSIFETTLFDALAIFFYNKFLPNKIQNFLIWKVLCSVSEISFSIKEG